MTNFESDVVAEDILLHPPVHASNDDWEPIFSPDEEMVLFVAIAAGTALWGWVMWSFACWLGRTVSQLWGLL